MRYTSMGAWLACFLFGVCGGAAAKDIPAPDTSAIVSVIGRHSMAHACPISSERVLTNAHVLDQRPFDSNVPLFGYRYSVSGVEGVLDPVFASRTEDVAGATVKPGSLRFYPIAKTAPQPGEQLWWVGYDWSGRDAAFSEKVFTGKVRRVVAGNIVIDKQTPQGSSGSCVLNAAGETVGLIAWSMEMDNGQLVAVAVGLYGPWFDRFTPPGEAPPPAPEAPPVVEPPPSPAPPASLALARPR